METRVQVYRQICENVSMTDGLTYLITLLILTSLYI